MHWGIDLWHAVGAFAAAFLAGTINSIAGGGTLVSFPALIWLRLSSVTANATSTVAIWPGTVGSLWGYRREIGSAEPRMYLLVIPSLVGGIAGAILLRWTPADNFDRLVPFLILFATVLFMAQEPVQRALKAAQAGSPRSIKWLAGAMLFQLVVGLYGGYFGAGLGILMLAVLAIIGLTDIHQMNGLKVVFAMCINGIAAVYFMAAGMVDWRYVILMAVGAIAGGYGGAGAARRLGRTAVRRIVIAVGFVMAVSLFGHK